MLMAVIANVRVAKEIVSAHVKKTAFTIVMDHVRDLAVEFVHPVAALVE